MSQTELFEKCFLQNFQAPPTSPPSGAPEDVTENPCVWDQVRQPVYLLTVYPKHQQQQQRHAGPSQGNDG